MLSKILFMEVLQKCFEPGDNIMVDDYPELAQFPELKKLSDVELRFVWFYSCKDSPYAMERDLNIKRINAIQKSGLQDNRLIKQITDRNFPEHILEAMNIMVKIRPDVRLKAKENNETMFDNLKLITAIGTIEVNQMSWEEKRVYADICAKVSKDQEIYINRIEHGYGYKKIKSKEEEGNIADKASAVISNDEISDL